MTKWHLPKDAERFAPMAKEIPIFSEEDDMSAIAFFKGKDMLKNAKLAAAAPDLLEALEAVKAEYDEHLADDERNFTTYRTVETAIAKAKGQ